MITYYQCDDCRAMYAGPPYYTFDPINREEITTHHTPATPGTEPCTGNLGPCCAGELIPDDEYDPRMPPDLARWYHNIAEPGA